MKKLIMFAACVVFAAVTQAAAVGWSLAGANAFAGDQYMFFVDGQKGASIASITALLDAGTDVSSYAFGSGVVAANGNAAVAATSSGATLEAGTYTGFYVMFDSATLTPGETMYTVVSGAANLTKTIAGTTAQVVFVAGNQSTYLNDASNWSSFGTASVPEPTSGVLMLVGLGALALRRKRA